MQPRHTAYGQAWPVDWQKQASQSHVHRRLGSLPVDGLPCRRVFHLQPCLPKDVNDCIVPQKVTWNIRDKVVLATGQDTSNWKQPQANTLHQS